MTPEEMEQVRPRLEAFAAEMLGGLTRADQRAKGELYLRGLMLDGKRKSMQPMAARLGVDHQRADADGDDEPDEKGAGQRPPHRRTTAGRHRRGRPPTPEPHRTS